MHRLIECLESFVKHIELLECMCGTVCESHEHRLFLVLELFISYTIFQD
jgi:hypothetical protein